MICHSRDTNEPLCSEKPFVAIILRLSEKWPQNDRTISVTVVTDKIPIFSVSCALNIRCASDRLRNELLRHCLINNFHIIL